MKKFYFAIFLMFLSVISFSQTCTGNLLQNPGFESGATYWGLIRVSNSHYYSGAQGAYLKDADEWQHQDVSAVVVGESYQLTFWADLADADGGVGSLVFYDAGDQQISITSVDIVGVGWKQYTLTGTAPANASYVTAGFYKGTATGKFYIDDVCLVEAANGGGGVAQAPHNGGNYTSSSVMLPADLQCPSYGSFIFDGQAYYEPSVDGIRSHNNAFFLGADSRVIPGPYPSEFSANVTIEVSDVIIIDSYGNRSGTQTQHHEQIKIEFYKNNNKVTETNNTPDLADGVTTAQWIGSLGSVTLPNGTDEIRIVSAGNSLVVAGICFKHTSNSLGGACAGNLFLDPSFENGSNPWHGAFTVSSNDKHSGSNSAYMENNQGDVYQEITGVDVVCGEDYTLTFWAKKNTTQNAWGHLIFYSGVNEILRKSVAITAAGWQEYSTTGQAPSGTDRIRFELERSGFAGQSMYFDDVCLTKQEVTPKAPHNEGSFTDNVITLPADLQCSSFSSFVFDAHAYYDDYHHGVRTTAYGIFQSGTGNTEYVIPPESYPEAFDYGVNINISEIITLDSHQGRSGEATQHHEQAKIQFFKNGQLKKETDYTIDLTDGVETAQQIGGLGLIHLPNGTDEIKIVTQGNSLIVSSICFQYSPISLGGGCAGNLLQNGSFELGSLAWEDVSVSDTHYHSGLRSIYLENEHEFISQNSTGIAPGEEYQLTFWADYADADYGKVTLTFYGPGYHNQLAQEEEDLGGTGWQEYTITATAPAGTEQIEVGIYRHEGNGRFYIDDVCLVNTTSGSGSIGQAPHIDGHYSSPNVELPAELQCSSFGNYFVLDSEVWFDDGRAKPTREEFRFHGSGIEINTIPGPYPEELNSSVTINVSEIIVYDAYRTRSTTAGEQNGERVKLQFFKNGHLEAETGWTGILEDYVDMAQWIGSLGTVDLPNGTDEIKIYNDGNSMSVSGICIRYEPMASTCPEHIPQGTETDKAPGCSCTEECAFEQGIRAEG